MESDTECSSGPKSGWNRWKVTLTVALVAASLSMSPLPLGDFFGRMLTPPEPEFMKDIKYLVTARGFELREHEVVTEDGYILTFHQIFDSKFNNTQRLPVLFGTPLAGVSTVFVVDGKNGLGFQFAAAGFDVWLANERGNRYGRRHVTLDSEKDADKFYAFTFIEHGTYDLAAQIDYITKHTNHSKLNFVGVSQGAAALFSLLAKRPEYNDKIAKAVSYGGFRSICFHNYGFVNFVQMGGRLLGDLTGSLLEPMMPSTPKLGHLMYWLPTIRYYIIIYALGFKSDYYADTSIIPLYMDHFPDGTSARNLLYYIQTMDPGCDGSVRDYNFDITWPQYIKGKLGFSLKGNLEHYGTKDPPLIDPKNIRVPIKMYYSTGDELAPPKEALNIASDVGIPEKDMHRIDDPRFSHFHFILNQRRRDFINHTMAYFHGIEAPWPVEN